MTKTCEKANTSGLGLQLLIPAQGSKEDGPCFLAKEKQSKANGTKCLDAVISMLSNGAGRY
jgi:hypothetical protein